MFESFAAVAPAAPGIPVAETLAAETLVAEASAPERAARRQRFQRDQAIVDCLNSGLPVSEIAAQFGVGEKRMRAVIREILARRMPAPPDEFIAIQVGRLHDALLVAYGALDALNLKAVDRVVRIVRELDRYHGFFPERRTGPSRRIADAGRAALADGAASFGPALLCRARVSMKVFEPIAVSADPGGAEGAALPTRADAEARDSALALYAGLERALRPDIPPQAAEKTESAPGPAGHRRDSGDPQPAPRAASRAGAQAAPDARVRGQEGGGGPDERPDIPPQVFEKAESAPGLAGHRHDSGDPQPAPRAALSAGPHAAPDAQIRGHDGGGRHERPDIPRQVFEKAESAPGFAGQAGEDGEPARRANPMSPQTPAERVAALRARVLKASGYRAFPPTAPALAGRAGSPPARG